MFRFFFFRRKVGVDAFAAGEAAFDGVGTADVIESDAGYVGGGALFDGAAFGARVPSLYIGGEALFDGAGSADALADPDDAGYVAGDAFFEGSATAALLLEEDVFVGGEALFDGAGTAESKFPLALGYTLSIRPAVLIRRVEAGPAVAGALRVRAGA
ncbi:MAG: hypothetical protein AAF532_02255 [Planctomycetota bacterium]